MHCMRMAVRVAVRHGQHDGAGGGGGGGASRMHERWPMRVRSGAVREENYDMRCPGERVTRRAAALFM